MFSILIVLLGFCGFLACDWTKCQFLSDEQRMVRHTLIDMNPVELKYYPFMIDLNKCTRSWNVLSSNICVPKETKDRNVKAFNIITNKDKAKAMRDHISCDCKCKFNSIKNGIIKHFNVNVKIMVSAKKIIVGIQHMYLW